MDILLTGVDLYETAQQNLMTLNSTSFRDTDCQTSPSPFPLLLEFQHVWGLNGILSITTSREYYKAAFGCSKKFDKNYFK